MIENSGRCVKSQQASEKLTWSVTLAIRKVTLRASARPPSQKGIRETDSRRRRSRCGARKGCGDIGNMGGGERIVPARMDC